MIFVRLLSIKLLFPCQAASARYLISSFLIQVYCKKDPCELWKSRIGQHGGIKEEKNADLISVIDLCFLCLFL